jgi:hypothetical protein
MLTDGVWAEVQVDNEHLRLFSEHNAQGVQASVYNVNTKSWLAPSEPVEDIEQGQGKSNRVRQGLPEACCKFGTAAVGVEAVPLGVVPVDVRGERDEQTVRKCSVSRKKS